jgi:hypothetical protein
MWESRKVTIEISRARWAAAETKGRPSTAPAFPQPSEPAMKPLTKQFALCLENAGNEASLILGKVYRVIPDARAAKDGLVRIIDESGEDYLYGVA